MDLVFEPIDAHIESVRAEGSSVILVRRANSRLSARELASLLRGKELSSAHALDEQRIEARFADQQTAVLVAEYAGLGFDSGPFSVDAHAPDRVRLLGRKATAIDAIELVTSSRSDEWRLLLAHELDVVPWANTIYRTEFAGMTSVRLVDIPANDTAALYFNVRTAALAQANVRRDIARGVNREAIARLVCGDPRCAVAIAPVEPVTPLPTRLSVLVPEDDSSLRSAARIIRHQLWRLNLEIEVRPMPVAKMVEAMTTGQFELAMLPLTLSDLRFGFFLSPGHPKGIPMTGFANKEYDTAVEGGDLATAQAILDREFPVTRLFELRSFAAIDSRFCGNVAPKASSWLWMSELYPCEEGSPP